MILLVIILSLNVPIKMVYGEGVSHTLEEAIAFMEGLSDKIDKLNSTIALLARQQILSQLYLEEKTRSDGDSGIKIARNTYYGTEVYHFNGGSFYSIHDHSDNIRTVGMGEFIGVVNGVEFRTRHNDYRLLKPSSTSQNFHETEKISFPDVPPEVLSLSTVEEQTSEMKEWFKAWKQQNSTILRNYTSYFKPVMCYLEGAWTVSGEQTTFIYPGLPSATENYIKVLVLVDDPFNATSWFDLEEAIRFVSYSGAKAMNEDLPYLPKAIMNITSENIPVFAHWNYRILCHPISFDLKLNRLRVVDDLRSRVIYAQTKEEFEKSKMARFSLNVADRMKFEDKLAFNKLLERIMNEIPGKNNYPNTLIDYGFEGIANNTEINNDNPIAAGFYHSRYSKSGKDISGKFINNRGFSDPNLFMALTNHSEIAGMDNINCFNGKQECPTDEYKHQKWTYAIPLEIIYLTPLNQWNPYDIELKGDCSSDIGMTVSADGRDGTFDNPYNGSCEQKFYITPTEIFLTGEVNQDPADTASENTVFVLDKNGVKRAVRSSGIRILLPAMDEETGISRQRYPVAPVHGEGSNVWKEVEALQDIVLSPAKFSHMYNEDDNTTLGDRGGDMIFKTSTSSDPPLHDHTFTLTQNQRASLNMGEPVNVVTDQSEGHTHTLELVFDEVQCTTDEYMYRYISCDGSDLCSDGHTVCVFVE